MNNQQDHFPLSTLVQWCMPVPPDRRLFRPFTCRGEIGKADIFFVAFSPKNCLPEDTPIEIAAQSCLEYDVLKKLIGERSSKTRQRFEEITPGVSLAAQGATIIETNAYAYPSLNRKSAKSLPDDVERKCRFVFVELFRMIKPKWIILFGENTVTRVSKILSDERVVQSFAEKWSRIDYGKPVVIDLAKVQVGGNSCHILGTRHPGDQQHGGYPYTAELFRRTWDPICAIIRDDCVA